MFRFRSRAVAAVGLTALAGCTPASDAPKLRSEIEEARTANESATAALRDRITQLEASLKDAEQKIFSLEMTNRLSRQALLTPGDTGYSVVQSDIGLLTMKLDDVKPYANGSKIRLQIGNPHSATISGAKFTVEWGKTNDKGGFDLDSRRTKEFSTVQQIRAGAWSTVEIALEGIPPTDLGYVEVSAVRHSGIALSR